MRGLEVIGKLAIWIFCMLLLASLSIFSLVFAIEAIWYFMTTTKVGQ